MNDAHLLSKCGVYCGACSIYQGSHGHPELLKHLELVLHVPAEKIKCNGCGEISDDCWCYGCEFISCVQSNNVDLCDNCEKYPCVKQTEFQNDKYPHHRLVKADVERRKEVGPEAWLKEQEQRWKCNRCGTKHTWYAQNCNVCGGSVESCPKP